MRTLFKIPCTLFILVFLFSCSSNRNNLIDKQLIDNFINNSEVVKYKTDGKILILKTGYCDKINCEKVFKGYEKNIVFYSKEELFMRGIRKFVEIENINKKTNKIILGLKNGANSKNIEIKL